VANNKSAIKRIRLNEKQRLRNRLVLASMRTAVKKARIAVDTSAENAAALVKAATSTIDSAVTKGSLKRTTASRYISRLATRKSA